GIQRQQIAVCPAIQLAGGPAARGRLPSGRIRGHAGSTVMTDPRAEGEAGAMRKPRVLVTSGDPGGVGPELILRALADPAVGGLAEVTIVGSPDGLRRDAAALRLPLPSIRPTAEAPAVPVGRPSADGAPAAVAAGPAPPPGVGHRGAARAG